MKDGNKEKDLLKFLKEAITPYHAVKVSKERLLDKGFSLLDPSFSSLKKGGKYFYPLGDGAFVAFILPKKTFSQARLLLSHLDSPSFRLKPNLELIKEGHSLLPLDIYGAPLLASWLNVPFTFGGVVFYKDHKKNLKKEIVNLTDFSCIVPELAIHLNRDVNEAGLKLNKQEHLRALFSTSAKKDSFIDYLKKKIKAETLLGFDLLAYPLQEAMLCGSNKEFLVGARLDNLVSSYAACSAIEDAKPHDEALLAFYGWNHEEIGSETEEGAMSLTVNTLLERVAHFFNIERNAFFKIIEDSFSLSLDMAHAYHPNYPEKEEPSHPIVLGKGVVLKQSSQRKYATSPYSLSLVHALALEEKIPCQFTIPRGDTSHGSTVGPLHATKTGIKTCDLGTSLLSMHSARELIDVKDTFSLVKLLQAFLNRKELPAFSEVTS